MAIVSSLISEASKILPISDSSSQRELSCVIKIGFRNLTGSGGTRLTVSAVVPFTEFFYQYYSLLLKADAKCKEPYPRES